MFEVMLIIEGEKVVHHSYNSRIAPISGDKVTIGETEVFEVKTRLLGGINNSDKIICIGSVITGVITDPILTS